MAPKSRLSSTTVEEEVQTSADLAPKAVAGTEAQPPVLRFLSSVITGFVDHFRDITDTKDIGLMWQPYQNSFT